jgi:multidrug efflux pump subunit AcrA (membrane-fusion protein)
MKHDPPPASEGGPPSLRPVKALRFVALIAIIAVGIAATGITSRRKDEDKLASWTVEQAIPDVAVIKAKHDDQVKGIVLPGDVEAFYSASIHGQTSGYVREWRADIGAKVKRGEVLAVVDTPELDQRVTAAEGELAKAKAKQVFAGVTANRWKTLGGSAAVSQQAIDEKASDVLVTDADVSAARANLDRLHALKGFSNITAPFDGVVTVRNVDIGSLVMPTQLRASRYLSWTNSTGCAFTFTPPKLTQRKCARECKRRSCFPNTRGANSRRGSLRRPTRSTPSRAR